jgi:hypothetical protein
MAGWKLLGGRKVDKTLDKDEILVGSKQGDFKRIKLRVEGAAIEIINVHVIYGNGEPDKLEVREHIRPGGETRAIDLRGGERVIHKVVLWYKTDTPSRKRATVTVWGLD